MNFKRSFLLFVIIGSFVYGCTNFKKQENKETIKLEDTVELKNDSIINSSESDTIRINIQNGKGHLKINKKERQYVNLVFNSGDFIKMTGQLSSNDSTANIRFSQIVMPNGEMDGPFGNSISYDLSMKGDYLLLIHENQMAGDPWSGTFEVDISLTK